MDDTRGRWAKTSQSRSPVRVRLAPGAEVGRSPRKVRFAPISVEFVRGHCCSKADTHERNQAGCPDFRLATAFRSFTKIQKHAKAIYLACIGWTVLDAAVVISVIVHS
jgi:hypothetical protein